MMNGRKKRRFLPAFSKTFNQSLSAPSVRGHRIKPFLLTILIEREVK
jgi:hypothetical protein